jgi:hypothetical protein
MLLVKGASFKTYFLLQINGLVQLKKHQTIKHNFDKIRIKISQCSSMSVFEANQFAV